VRRERPTETKEGKVKLSNLDKVFWPEEEITKGDLIDYYRAVAGVLVPHCGSALHDAALPRRRVRQGVLPEGRAEGHAGVDPALPRAGLDTRGRRRSAGSKRRWSTTRTP
jgi:Predicted eukaryotic-type DNA primase